MKYILLCAISLFNFVVNMASLAVASGNQAVLVNLFDIFESVVEVRETEGHAVHVATDSPVVDKID